MVLPMIRMNIVLVMNWGKYINVCVCLIADADGHGKFIVLYLQNLPWLWLFSIYNTYCPHDTDADYDQILQKNIPHDADADADYDQILQKLQ